MRGSIRVRRKEKMTGSLVEKLKLCVSLLHLQPIIKACHFLLWNISWMLSFLFVPECPPPLPIPIQTFIPHHFTSDLLQQGRSPCLWFLLSLLSMWIPGLRLLGVYHSQWTPKAKLFCLTFRAFLNRPRPYSSLLPYCPHQTVSPGPEHLRPPFPLSKPSVALQASIQGSASNTTC